MPASFVTYIDESGCDGFRVGEGSSEWFIISAAIFRHPREVQDTKVVDIVRDKLKLAASRDLHFAELKHEQRVVYTMEVAKCKLRSVTVCIHKQSLADKGSFQVKNHLYHFATRLLLERVSWLCKEYYEKNDGGDGTSDLIFSHRRSLSYEDLKKYLIKLKSQGTDMDWESIDPSMVRALPHRQRKGLWIADCVASSFFQGMERNRHGFTEGRYALTLRPTVWNKKGAFSGAGIKIFPKEALAMLDLDGDHRWLTGYGIVAQ